MSGAADDVPFGETKRHEFIGQAVEKGTFNEVFGGECSLVESLQVTSGSLLPPFKTVRVQQQ